MTDIFVLLPKCKRSNLQFDKRTLISNNGYVSVSWAVIQLIAHSVHHYITILRAILTFIQEH